MIRLNYHQKPVLFNKFACFNLAAKFSDFNFLNSGVVVYLSWLWSAFVFSISSIFVVSAVFLTKLLTLGISYSTALRAVLVAELVILGISPLTSLS